MLIQTFRACVGLGMLLAFGVSTLRATDVQVASAAVNVSVYDDAGVGLETVEQAEETASYVFYRAGVQVNWLNCSVPREATQVGGTCGKAVFPTNLQLRIVRHSRNLRPDIFGISYLSEEGIGCYSHVFVEPVEELRKIFPMSLATVLGHAAAHEIAHLLLGTNSHSAMGIMRARWQLRDLVSATQGVLLFDQVESGNMRARLADGMRRNAEAALGAARVGGNGAN